MGIEIRNLINKLNAYTELYDNGAPAISDEEWDKLYFELKKLEQESGLIYPDSPTQKISYTVVNELQKVEHNHPMLSLAKTKDIAKIVEFLHEQEFVAMSKMDGLTCSLLYQNGKLVRAETRGNGEIGEDITHNVLVIPNIPKEINYKEELIIDGEVICDLGTFDQYFATEYKNPRNFAAGSIRLLDAKESENRRLTFVAWEVIKGMENCNTLIGRLNYLYELGFTVVPRMTSEIFDDTVFITGIAAMSKAKNYPIDGIVFKFNDIAYGKSLGSTDHHFNNAIAFKFYDEAYETKLLDIEWGMGRTGQLTPIAVFEPVDDGESVLERASLHNISVMRETLGEEPYVGETVYVAKMNQIIPQIVKANIEDLPDKQVIRIPLTCPVCGGAAEIVESESGTKNLCCTNSACQGKLINRLDHFAGIKGLDIKGLSKATLEKLIEWGWIDCLKDIFSLKEHRAEWIKKSGFGVASVDKVLAAIEASKNTTLDKFITSLGIPLIGSRVAKDIAARVYDYGEFRDLIIDNFDFSSWEGFGDSKKDNLLKFDYTEADEIYKLLNIATQEQKPQNDLNLTVCITGSLKKYKNRAELQSAIEATGGKVVSSISKKVNYLINNDVNSTSSKNQQAKKLNIPIISEDDFAKKYLIS